jgi:hypothetical protein
MLHMFHLDVLKIDLLLHMLQWLYMYVASVCFKYFICFKHILQVFYVVYVVMTIYVCCKRMFQIFHLFQTYVAIVLCCICCNGHIHMLQVYVSNVSIVQTYVAIVLSECCIRTVVIHICCKRMFVKVGQADRHGNSSNNARTSGPAQAKWEVETRCTRPFRWPCAFRGVGRLGRLLPY